MEAVFLTLAMYFTPEQLSHDAPQVTVLTFQTYAECETYIEIHKPEIEKELTNGLLGYSARCEVGN
jgi:hypothetical protein